MDSANQDVGAVERNKSKNKGFAIYLGSLGAAGIGLMLATYFLDWGFWGWFGGGFLIVAGLGGLGSMAKTGGVGNLRCPACFTDIEVMHISQKRIIACPDCKTYLEGAEQMTEVPKERVADHAAFIARLVEPVNWPAGCPLCGADVTRRVKIEGMSMGGTMAALALPVSVTKTYSIEAPACSEHDDGVSLFVVSKDEGKLQVGFRSFAYYKKFCELNNTSA